LLDIVSTIPHKGDKWRKTDGRKTVGSSSLGDQLSLPVTPVEPVEEKCPVNVVDLAKGPTQFVLGRYKITVDVIESGGTDWGRRPT
jgi:hypothetical protein